MKDEEDFSVSSTDEESLSGGTTPDRDRKLGEFKPTNSPLSAADLEHRQDTKKKRKQGWVPRTTENIQELTPIRDDQPPKR